MTAFWMKIVARRTLFKVSSLGVVQNERCRVSLNSRKKIKSDKIVKLTFFNIRWWLLELAL
jgi:hypothetical protein